MKVNAHETAIGPIYLLTTSPNRPPVEEGDTIELIGFRWRVLEMLAPTPGAGQKILAERLERA